MRDGGPTLANRAWRPLVAAALLAAPVARGDAPGTRPVDCTRATLQLRLVTESDRVARIVARNDGARACRLAGLPPLVLEYAAGTPLPIVRRVPPGLHPGPVVLPVTVSSHAETRATLSWSDDASRGARCVRVAAGLLSLASGPTAAAPFAATLCGPSDGPIQFDQTPFR